MSFRKLLAAALIAGLSQLVLMGSAAADVPKGVYLGVDGGLAWTSNITYTTYYGGCYPPYYCSYPYYYNAVTFDLGYQAGAQIGYAFGGPRVEFEYSYRNNGASTIATTSGTQNASGSLTSNNFMVNALYDFDTGSKWVPYVGLGLGMADVSASTIKPSAAIAGAQSGYIDGSSSKFAVQFIFGAEYLASDNIGIFVDWRGLWASNVNLNYGIGCTSGTTSNCAQTGSTNWDYWNGALNIGLHVRF